MSPVADHAGKVVHLTDNAFLSVADVHKNHRWHRRRDHCRFGIQQRRRSGDLDALGQGADLQVGVKARHPARTQLEAFAYPLLESSRDNGDAVGSRVQSTERSNSLRVGRAVGNQLRPRVDDGYLDVWHGGAGWLSLTVPDKVPCDPVCATTAHTTVRSRKQTTGRRDPVSRKSEIARTIIDPFSVHPFGVVECAAGCHLLRFLRRPRPRRDPLRNAKCPPAAGRGGIEENEASDSQASHPNQHAPPPSPWLPPKIWCH